MSQIGCSFDHLVLRMLTEKKSTTTMRWSFIAYVYYTVLVLLLWYGQACELLHQMQAKVYMCDASKTLPPNCDIFWANDYLSFCIISEPTAPPNATLVGVHNVSNVTSYGRIATVRNTSTNASLIQNASTTSTAALTTSLNSTTTRADTVTTTSLTPTTLSATTTTTGAPTTTVLTPASTTTTTFFETTTPVTTYPLVHRVNGTMNNGTPISANSIEQKERQMEEGSSGMVVAVVVLSVVVVALGGYVVYQRRKARRVTVSQTIVPKARKRPPPIKTRSLTLPRKHNFSRPKPRVHRYSHHDRAVIPSVVDPPSLEQPRSLIGVPEKPSHAAIDIHSPPNTDILLKCESLLNECSSSSIPPPVNRKNKPKVPTFETDFSNLFGNTDTSSFDSSSVRNKSRAPRAPKQAAPRHVHVPHLEGDKPVPDVGRHGPKGAVVPVHPPPILERPVHPPAGNGQVGSVRQRGVDKLLSQHTEKRAGDALLHNAVKPSQKDRIAGGTHDSCP